MTILFSMIAVGCVIWAVSAGLLAIGHCRQRGVAVNPVFLGVEMLRCLSQYRRITRIETGHVGPLFYHCVIPINLALAFVIILLVAKLV